MTKSDFDLELGRHQNQIDSLSRSIDTLIKRIQKVETLERSDWKQESAVRTNTKSTSNPLNDPERTIIVSNLKQNQDEDILETATDLVRCLSDSASVVAALRLKSRLNGKPGLVKISFQSTEEKIEVLRRKRDLREVDVYKSVFLRSSKSHAERLIELNAKNHLKSNSQW